MLKGQCQAVIDLVGIESFANAAIADAPELEMLREEIKTRFGETALVAASFAASSGRIYPVLKRSLGFGQACSLVTIQDEPVKVLRQT